MYYNETDVQYADTALVTTDQLRPQGTHRRQELFVRVPDMDTCLLGPPPIKNRKIYLAKGLAQIGLPTNVGKRIAPPRPSPEPSHRSLFHMIDVVDSQRIETFVEGIDDPTLVGAIEAALCDSLRQTALPGPWRVVVAPSGVGGRWDLSVRGPGRRHLITISVPRELLPELIPSRLRESLHRPAACLVERTGLPLRLSNREA